MVRVLWRKKIIPIVTSFTYLGLGVVLGCIWPLIQNNLTNFGDFVAGSEAIGDFGFGVSNRLLIPIGLHHVMNSIFWFDFATFILVDSSLVNEAELKKLGASGVMKMSGNNVQVIVGTLADLIVTYMEKLI